MIFEEKTIILKDGRAAILKSPCVEDAEKLLNYNPTSYEFKRKVMPWAY